MASLGVLAPIIILMTLVGSIPIIAYPLNSQVPPVARFFDPYSYTLSSSTFLSTLRMTYVLSSGPSWLSLNEKTLTLSGTPANSNTMSSGVIGIPVGITARDAMGSTELNSTLVISRNSAPAVKISPTKQLASFGIFSYPSTLLYHPSTSFMFRFDSETFSGDGLHYYAVTTDNTPLPA